MGLLKLLIEVLDYCSTAMAITVLSNMVYTAAVDYMVSDYEDVVTFLFNYTPDFKSLKFYKAVVTAIINRII